MFISLRSFNFVNHLIQICFLGKNSEFKGNNPITLGMRCIFGLVPRNQKSRHSVKSYRVGFGVPVCVRLCIDPQHSLWVLWVRFVLNMVNVSQIKHYYVNWIMTSKANLKWFVRWFSKNHLHFCRFFTFNQCCKLCII